MGGYYYNQEGGISMVGAYKPLKFKHYHNTKRLTIEQIKAEQGCDIVLNSVLFNPDGTACCDMRIDGKTIVDDQYGYFGFAWNKNDSKIQLVSSGNGDWLKYDNFATCYPLIMNGQKLEIYASQAHKSVARGQTALATLSNDKILIFCTTDSVGAISRLSLQQYLLNNTFDGAKVVDCVSFDGGRSCGTITPDWFVKPLNDFGSSRRRYIPYYICIWVDKGEQKPVEEMKPSPLPQEHKIIEHSWKWNGTITYRKLTNAIVLHHAAGYGTAESIHNYHKSLGWLGIAYHYYVRLDGTIHRGRPEGACGGHVAGYNYCTIGICAEGNYEVDEMPVAQREALKWLVADVKKRYPVAVKPHKAYGGTVCPGNLYPLDYIVGNTNTAPPQPPTNTTTISNEGYIKTFQNWLNVNYRTNLIVDGIYGKNTKKAAIKVYQNYLNIVYKANLVEDGIWGIKTKTATRNVSQNNSGLVVYIIQGLLYCHGFNCNGFDGYFGRGMLTSVKAFQSYKKLASDGIVGKNTFEALMK